MNTISIFTALVVTVAAGIAVWAMFKLHIQRLENDELEDECERLRQEVAQLLLSKNYDAQKIAALRQQLAAVGAPTTVRPPPPRIVPAPIVPIRPHQAERSETVREAMQDETRSDNFTNTLLLMNLFPASTPVETTKFESGGGGDFGGGGASGSWSDDSSSSSSDSSSSSSDSGSSSSGD